MKPMEQTLPPRPKLTMHRTAQEAFQMLALEGWELEENTPTRTMFVAVENRNRRVCFTTPQFLWAVAHGLEDVRALVRAESDRLLAERGL